MSTYTKNLSKYIKEKGINLSKMARDTGISYSALYSSLMDPDRKRDLRDYEFMSICFFLGVNPRDFADKEKEVVRGRGILDEGYTERIR